MQNHDHQIISNIISNIIIIIMHSTTVSQWCPNSPNLCSYLYKSKQARPPLSMLLVPSDLLSW
jgi:hypothetical protein